jgi:N-acetylmuramoyl-L-alanine amidase CwlA
MIVDMITEHNREIGRKAKTEYIVVHWVGAASTARNNGKYFAGEGRNASAHYFVDKTETVRVVRDEDTAWHCGGGKQDQKSHLAPLGAKFYLKCTNANSVGVEMCCEKENGALTVTQEVQKRTAELVAELMEKHGVPIEKVIRHFDVTGKLCPLPLLFGDLWEKFKSIVEDCVMTEEKVREIIRKELAGADGKPSSWADFWETAKAEGVTDGTKPKGYATREQVIQFLYRAIGKAKE